LPGVVGVVDDHGKIGGHRVQRQQASDLVFAQHGRGQQQLVEPAPCQRLGFTELGAAQADRAGFHLSLADRDGLVGLGMRPQPDPALAGQRGHGLDIVVEGIQVEHQNRRV
jgi:hypothetical protein